MQVTVEYTAQLKRAAGLSSETIQINEGSSLKDLVDQITKQHDPALKSLLVDEQQSLQPSILLFVGDDQIRGDLDRQLHDQDVVTFLSPISGG